MTTLPEYRIGNNGEDPIFEANVEALTRNESGQMYHNAKLSYCTDPAGAIGCKGALFRNCTGVFCID